MQLKFNDTTDQLGIIQEMESIIYGDDLTQISGNSNRLKIATRYVNGALDKYFHLAMTADGTWQLDDANYTTHPSYTTNLVASQHDYELSTDFMKVEGVDVKDPDGNFYELTPLEESNQDKPLDERYSTDGKPQYYTLRGESVFVYPAPASGDVTLASGLRIHVQRVADYFDSTDTAKTPGIPTIHHDYLPLRASYDWKGRVINEGEKILRDLQIYERQIIDHFAMRNKDDKSNFGSAHGTYAARGGFR